MALQQGAPLGIIQGQNYYTPIYMVVQGSQLPARPEDLHALPSDNLNTSYCTGNQQFEQSFGAQTRMEDTMPQSNIVFDGAPLEANVSPAPILGLNTNVVGNPCGINMSSWNGPSPAIFETIGTQGNSWTQQLPMDMAMASNSGSPANTVVGGPASMAPVSSAESTPYDEACTPTNSAIGSEKPGVPSYYTPESSAGELSPPWNSPFVVSGQASANQTSAPTTALQQAYFTATYPSNIAKLAFDFNSSPVGHQSSGSSIEGQVFGDETPGIPGFMEQQPVPPAAPIFDLSVTAGMSHAVQLTQNIALENRNKKQANEVEERILKQVLLEAQTTRLKPRRKPRVTGPLFWCRNPLGQAVQIRDRDIFTVPYHNDDEESKHAYLLACREKEINYKDIKHYGGFDQIVDTLRGTHRNLTKPEHARLRNPESEWTLEQCRALMRVVGGMKHLKPGARIQWARVAWALAEFLRRVRAHRGQGGRVYEFAGAACNKKHTKLSKKGDF